MSDPISPADAPAEIPAPDDNLQKLPVLFVPDLVVLPGMVVSIELDDAARATVDAARSGSDGPAPGRAPSRRRPGSTAQEVAPSQALRRGSIWSRTAPRWSLWTSRS